PDGGGVGGRPLLGLPRAAHARGDGPLGEAPGSRTQRGGGRARPLGRAPRPPRAGRPRGALAPPRRGGTVVTHARRLGLAFLAAPSAIPLAACRTGARPGCPCPGGDAPAQPVSDEVVLTDRDLAPMDGFVRRRRWILGDDVEVVASKEYFAPIL